jgi:hypothetical protein
MEDLVEDSTPPSSPNPDGGHAAVQAPSTLWSIAIGLGKLQGDTAQIRERFAQALDSLHGLGSMTASKLMAAEIMTAVRISRALKPP